MNRYEATSEADIEKYLVRRTKEMKGEVRKVRWVGRRGAPDRLVMLPRRSIWVELKSPGQKPKPHQTREHERMKRMGLDVVVIDSFEGVEKVLM